MTLMMVATALGWVGAIAGLVAYAMVSRGRWNADSLAFQGTNMLAGVTMLTVAATNGVWPSAAANIAAILIGANAVATVLRAKKRKADQQAESAPALTVVEDTVRDDVAPAAQPAVSHRAYAEAA
jgi:LytS/YehU family sensor histidine kinase